ncbi:uncharacterized protein [Amphiura filiformis]|uniref:uncharacterized protein n=1 Tax=Amphiura filiformis TaxID=82378 RepID=UPI003B21AF4A
MATAAAEFFQRDTHHGLVKRIMYKKYLQAYVAKTQQMAYRHPAFRFAKTIIIDGFAGAGRYRDKDDEDDKDDDDEEEEEEEDPKSTWQEEIEKYGSPMIALLVVLQFFCNKLYGKQKWDPLHKDVVSEVNQNEANQNEPPRRQSGTEDSEKKIYLYFVEKSSENFEQLVICVETYLYTFLKELEMESCLVVQEVRDQVDFYVTHGDFLLECHIRNCEFTDFAPPPMPEFSRRLTFLDPCGFSQTPMEQVHQYLGPYSEVLINFMSGYVNRFCGKSVEKIAALYGIDLPARQEMPNLGGFLSNIVRMGENIPAENAKNCSRSYIEHIKEYTHAEYASLFEIRGEGNAVIYHLIHFTHHRKGLEAMKESMNTCSQYEGTFKMSDYRIVREGIALTIGNQQDDADVAEEVYQEFRGKQGVPIGDVETFVWEHSPYVYRKGILKILETSDPPRLISVENEDTEEARDRRRNSYPDWGKWLLTFAD